MFLPRTVRSLGFLLAGGLLITGCEPGPNTPLDEQKDPHFLRGRNYATALDYEGAIRSFEEAIRSNPNSASAHKELGLLYFQRRKDHARAIYHFQRLLELRPDDEHADIIRDNLVSAKRALAGEVALLPATQAMQKNLEQIEQLKQENEALRKQLELYKAYLAQAQRAAVAPRLHPNPTLLTGTNSTPEPQAGPDVAGSADVTQAADTRTLVDPTPPAPPPPPSRTTYTVKSGDTPTSIAGRHGVSVQKLMAANPRLDPRKMQIGQVLNIPAR